MGRPLNKRYFTNTSNTGEQIQVDAWVEGDNQSRTGYIVKQKGTHKYEVTTSGGTSVCKLVDGTPAAAGEMSIPVYTSGVAGSGATATATMKVVSATIANPGTSGTDGTQTVTGTTGTGTKFTASVKIEQGEITEILEITLGGSYTVLPTSLAAEPVTGASLTGAELAVVMGVNTVTVTAPGSDYDTAPTVSFSTSGSSVAATATAEVEGGEVTGITVNTAGTGYTAIPTVTITAANSGGTVEYAKKITGRKVVTFDGNVYAWSVQGTGEVTTGRANIRTA